VGGGAARSTPAPTGASFADVLKDSIGEVSRLQQDASQAVENLATGKTEDVTGVMTAMEKSDLAFKTLLAIRAKLMDAYEEIKSISV
jgi:flagellar hook-basal body complex protein FliE